MLNFAESDSTAWTRDNNPEGLRLWWRVCGANSDGTPKADVPTYSLEGPSGTPDQFARLYGQLKMLYEQYGFRRFILNHPAGSMFGREFVIPNGQPHAGAKYFGGEDIPFNEWDALPQWKQQQFSSPAGVFQAFRLKHTDATFELYMGSAILDNTATLHMHANSETYPGTQTNLQPAPTGDTPEIRNCFNGSPLDWNSSGLPISRQYWIKRNTQVMPEISFDPRESAHLARLSDVIGPWIACGFKMFWLDAGVMSVCNGPANQHRRYGLDEICSDPYYMKHGVRFGGENIPAGNNHDLIETCSTGRTPYMELDGNIFDVPNGQWRFTNRPVWDPTQAPESECHYLVSTLIAPNGFTSFEQVGEARLRGYIATPYYAKWRDDFPNDEEHALRIVQRWYSQGTIPIADFNGDGVVNQTDIDDFNRAWGRWNENGSRTLVGDRKIVVFGMGDVNGDGGIDNKDQTVFMDAVSQAVGGSLGPTITFPCPIGL